MTTQTVNYIQDSALGKPQAHERLTVIPLTVEGGAGPDYITLSQALSLQLLVITEVSESGSVPDLIVKNLSDQAVLLLDGEELVGAKQNRVLNTTVLLKEKSEIKVPVSCTEQGRWSYLSEEFADSGTVMSPSVRQHKVRSVSKSLRTTGNRLSDQCEVWDEIDKLSLRAGVSSDTGAMRDVYESRQEKLEEYTESITLQDGQTGLLTLISGKIIGFDNVSRPEAFSHLFPKLLKSYAMDAILSQSEQVAKDPIDQARKFLNETTLATKTEHESLGYGKDYRFTGDALVGSALEVDKTSVHMAFFRSNASDRVESMSSSMRRRGFRQ